MRRRRRSTVAGDVDAAATLEAAAREIRTGTSLPAAVHAALERHPTVLPDTLGGLQRGQPLCTAIERSTPRGPAETVVHQVLLAASSSGGPVADTLERGVDVLRERRAWAEERRAQAAQARLSALLLTLVPVGFAGLGIATSDRVRAAYTEVPVTVPVSVFGLLMNLAGWWWMRRLIVGAAP